MNAFNTSQLSQKIAVLEARLEASEARERTLYNALYTFARALEISGSQSGINWAGEEFIKELRTCEPPNEE